MESYLEETSYTFFPSVDGSMGYTFDSQFIPYPSGDSLDSFLYPFSFQTCQQPMPMMATSPTLSDFTFNTAYATPSPPPDFSPVPSEQFEFAPSPSSVTTSPSSPPKESEVDSWGPSDLHQMGYLDVAGNWRCRYAGCCSSRVFLRACDLRKHFRGHAKYFFCTEKRCQQAGVGFATRKDFQRHMGSHKPAVRCLHPDCDRIFSRKDNMGTLQKDSPTVKKQLVSSAMPQDHAERASAGRFSGIDLLKLHDGFLN
ncbi:Trichothecene biosynthesis transcription regulator TRI6 [Colletotrichum siamense]|uniref:Trichothecene biosynthesis transcription regulator TRI6 n=1 Tax=Colletotrichum siamense TaxID=690259 RepID=UPI001873070A|nr:Trichothecene biosynthesis transcription regulator TRI6 [Colletotrichum siamense]KAF5505351.1 Trichothecene biosynthesis transcription regulator TRI6 [Colletotrichum siamense]